MKYPPTRVRGWPVSACQRSGSVNVDIGTGTTSTVAEAGRSSAPNAADQPGGTVIAATAGSGRGTMGSTARTAQPVTVAIAAVRLQCAARTGTAASAQQASSAAAAPSATMENRSGSAALSTGRPCSQYQGSLSQACSCPLASRVPPSENTSSTTSATAQARTASSRQNRITPAASTTISGQPR